MLSLLANGKSIEKKPMKTVSLKSILAILLICLGVAAQAAVKPVPLAFSEFFVPSSTALQPSPKLLALSGKRVRLDGYMVKTEEALPGAFYLTAHPTFCDEEGAGTADLPPACVRVIVRGAKNRPLSFVGRPLIVTGILQVGAQTEADGQISHFRLILDGPEPTSLSAAHTQLSKKQLSKKPIHSKRIKETQR